MDGQIASTKPELMVIALAQTVIESVEDTALLPLEIDLEPPCLFEESHVDLPQVNVRSGQNDTIRLRSSLFVNRKRRVISVTYSPVNRLTLRAIQINDLGEMSVNGSPQRKSSGLVACSCGRLLLVVATRKVKEVRRRSRVAVGTGQLNGKYEC